MARQGNAGRHSARLWHGELLEPGAEYACCKHNPASATVQKACFTSGTQGTLLLNFPLVRIGRSVTTLVVEVYRVLCCVLLILISSLDSSVVFRRLGFRDSMDSHDSDGPCT